MTTTTKDRTRKPRHTKKETLAAIGRSSGVIAVAARSLGITRQTLSRHIHNNPEYKEALDQAREDAIDTAESKLIEAINDREPWAICFFLKCQAKHRGYIEKSEMQVSNDSKSPLIIKGPDSD